MWLQLLAQFLHPTVDVGHIKSYEYFFLGEKINSVVSIARIQHFNFRIITYGQNKNTITSFFILTTMKYYIMVVFFHSCIIVCMSSLSLCLSHFSIFQFHY